MSVEDAGDWKDDKGAGEGEGYNESLSCSGDEGQDVTTRSSVSRVRSQPSCGWRSALFRKNRWRSRRGIRREAKDPKQRQ
jgi:hypothetical protein